MANSTDNTAGISEQQKQKLAQALGTGAAATQANSSKAAGKEKGSTDSIEARVLATVEDATGVEREEISRSSSFDNDLNMDSLTLVDIAVRLEEEFNIQVEDEAINNVNSVGELVQLVEQRVKEA